MDVINKVNRALSSKIKKNKQDIDNATIKPLTDDYPFSTNGIYLFCWKMGSCKTFTILKHLRVIDKLLGEIYYDLIIFSSTSGELDKTVESIKQLIKTEIRFIKDADLMAFLEKRIKEKMKFYAIIKFIKTDGQVKNEVIEAIIEKHKLKKIVKGEWVPDMRGIGLYLIEKLDKLCFKQYPA